MLMLEGAVHLLFQQYSCLSWGRVAHLLSQNEVVLTGELLLAAQTVCWPPVDQLQAVCGIHLPVKGMLGNQMDNITCVRN